MISDDGWLDWAERVPGPAQKVYPGENDSMGIACHSMEGYYDGSLAELNKPSRQASWHFSNLLDGRLVQHYPVTARCWASGNYEANRQLWAVESEGVVTVDGPLNDAQVRTFLRLCAEFEQETELTATRRDGGRTVWQHNEVWNWATPNAGPTACPSGRYDAAFAALEEDAMTPEELRRLERLERLVAGNGYRAAPNQMLTGEAAMAAADADGGSLYLGLGEAQGKLADHIANHAAGVAGNVGEHTHIQGGVKR